MRRALLAAAAALAVSACNPGAYPVDPMNEMHYSPAQRRLEPGRLAPPSDAVPVTGSSPDYGFDEAGALQNPIVRDPQNLQRAAEIYRVNCAMCHGLDGHGTGPLVDYFKGTGSIPPVDLASERVRSRTDGQLYWLVGHGIGNMPAFRQLLPESDLWLTVHFIRQLQGR
jgi:mono/diheme cytochrome c family protein